MLGHQHGLSAGSRASSSPTVSSGLRNLTEAHSRRARVNILRVAAPWVSEGHEEAVGSAGKRRSLLPRPGSNPVSTADELCGLGQASYLLCFSLSSAVTSKDCCEDSANAVTAPSKAMES